MSEQIKSLLFRWLNIEGEVGIQTLLFDLVLVSRRKCVQIDISIRKRHLQELNLHILAEPFNLNILVVQIDQNVRKELLLPIRALVVLDPLFEHIDSVSF